MLIGPLLLIRASSIFLALPCNLQVRERERVRKLLSLNPSALYLFFYFPRINKKKASLGNFALRLINLCIERRDLVARCMFAILGSYKTYTKSKIFKQFVVQLQTRADTIFKMLPIFTGIGGLQNWRKK